MSENTSIGLSFELSTNNYKQTADQLQSIAKDADIIIDKVSKIRGLGQTKIEMSLDNKNVVNNINEISKYLEKTVKSDTEIKLTLNGEKFKGELSKVIADIKVASEKIEIPVTVTGDKEAVIKLKDLSSQGKKLTESPVEIKTSVTGDTAVTSRLSSIESSLRIAETQASKFAVGIEQSRGALLQYENTRQLVSEQNKKYDKERVDSYMNSLHVQAQAMNSHYDFIKNADKNLAEFRRAETQNMHNSMFANMNEYERRVEQPNARMARLAQSAQYQPPILSPMASAMGTTDTQNRQRANMSMQMDAEIRRQEADNLAYRQRQLMNDSHQGGGGQTSVINELSNSLNKLQQTLMLVGVAMSGRQIMDYADQWTHFTNAVGIATQKTGDAVGMQEKLFALAQNSRAPLESITTLYLRMARAGETLNMSQGQTVQMIDTVTKSLAIMGTSPTMVRGGLLQLEQALGGVTVRGQEFKSILDSMPNVMTTVAKHYMESEKTIKLNEAALRGASQAEIDAIKSQKSHELSISQLRNMMYEGKVSSEAFAQAIIAGQNEIDIVFSKTHKTFAQAFTTIENGFIKWVGGINEATKASDEFYKISQKIADNFDIISKTIAAVAISLGSYAVMIGVRWAAVAHPLTLVASAIIGIGTAFYEMKDNLKIGDSLATWGNAFDIVINDIKSKFTELKAFFDTYVKPIFSGLGIVLTAAINEVVESPVFQALRSVFEKLTGEIGKYVDSVKERAIQKASANVELTSTTTLGVYTDFTKKTEIPLLGLNTPTTNKFPQVTYTSLSNLAGQTTIPFKAAMEEQSPEYKESQNLQRLREAQAKQNAADEIAKQNGALAIEKSRLDYEIQRKSMGVDDNKVLQEYMNNLKSYMSVYNEGAAKKVKHELELEEVLQRQNPIVLTSLRNKAEELVLVDKQLTKTKEITADLENQRKAAPAKQSTFDESVDSIMSKFKDTVGLQTIKLHATIDKEDALKRLDELNPLFEKYATGNVTPQLLRAVAAQESKGISTAINKESGAAGLMQFMPDTAKGFGINPLNAEQSILAANKYFNQLLKMFDGDMAKALASYNWGQGNVKKAIEAKGKDWLSLAPKETQDYIPSVMGRFNDISQSKEVLAVYEQEKKIKSEELQWQTLLKEGKNEEAAAMEKKITLDISHLTHLTQEQTRQEQINTTVQSGLRAQTEEYIKLYNLRHQFDTKSEDIAVREYRNAAIVTSIAEKGAGAISELAGKSNLLKYQGIYAAEQVSSIQQQIDEQKKMNIPASENEARNQRIVKLLEKQKEAQQLLNQATAGMTQYARANEQIIVKQQEAATLAADYVTKTMGLKSPTRLGQLSAVHEEIKSQQDKFGISLDKDKQAKFESDIAKQLADKTLKVNIEFDNKAMQDAMSEMQALATNLKNIFGTVGESIGNVGIALTGTLEKLVANNGEIEKLNAAYQSTQSTDEYKNNVDIRASYDKQYHEQKQKLDMQSTETAIGGMANIAGATSKLFAEQSAGRKALHAVEVGLHGIEMAMSVAKIAMNIAEGASKFFAQGGFAGFAGIGAMMAVMGALGFGAVISSGSSKPEDSSHGSSETSGTVLGSSSSSNSIKIVTDALYDIHSKQFPLLKKMSEEFTLMSQGQNAAIVQSLKMQGSFIPSTIGITAPAAKSPLGSGTMVGANLIASGAIGAAGLGTAAVGGMANMAIGAGMSTVGSALGGIATAATNAAISTGLSLGASASASMIVGGAVLGLAGGLIIAGLQYGLGKLLGIGKTKFEAIGEGLIVNISNSVTDGVVSAQAEVFNYSTIKATTKGWFSNTVKIYDIINGVNTEMSNTFSQIFNSLLNGLSSVSSIIYSKGDFAKKAADMPKIGMGFNFTGKSQDDIAKMMTDAMSTMSDKIASYFYGGVFKSLQKMGEGMLTTVQRVFSQASEVIYQFARLTKDPLLSLNDSTVKMTASTVAFSDSLTTLYQSTADSTDGLKNFTSAMNSFYDATSSSGKKIGDAISSVNAAIAAAQAAHPENAILAGASANSLNLGEILQEILKIQKTDAETIAATQKVTAGTASVTYNQLTSTELANAIKDAFSPAQVFDESALSSIAVNAWKTIVGGDFNKATWSTGLLNNPVYQDRLRGAASAASQGNLYYKGFDMLVATIDANTKAQQEALPILSKYGITSKEQADTLITTAKDTITKAQQPIQNTVNLANSVSTISSANANILDMLTNLIKPSTSANIMTTGGRVIESTIQKKYATSDDITATLKTFDSAYKTHILSSILDWKSKSKEFSKDIGISSAAYVAYNNYVLDNNKIIDQQAKHLYTINNLITDGKPTTAYQQRINSYNEELRVLTKLNSGTPLQIQNLKDEQKAKEASSFATDLYNAKLKAQTDTATAAQKVAIQYQQDVKVITDKWGEGTKESKLLIDQLATSINGAKLATATQALKDFGKTVADWAIGLKITQLGSTKSQLDTAAAKFDYQIAALNSLGGIANSYSTANIVDPIVKSAMDTFIKQTGIANQGKTVEEIKSSILSGLTGNADQLITAIKNFYGSSKEGNDLIQKVIDQTSAIPQQIDPQLQMVDLLSQIKDGTYLLDTTLSSTAKTTVQNIVASIASLKANMTIPNATKQLGIDTLAKLAIEVISTDTTNFSNAIKTALYGNVTDQVLQVNAVLSAKVDPLQANKFLSDMGFKIDQGMTVIEARLANPNDAGVKESTDKAIVQWNAAIASINTRIDLALQDLSKTAVDTATVNLTDAITAIEQPIILTFTDNGSITAIIKQMDEVIVKAAEMQAAIAGQQAAAAEVQVQAAPLSSYSGFANAANSLGLPYNPAKDSINKASTTSDLQTLTTGRSIPDTLGIPYIAGGLNLTFGNAANDASGYLSNPFTSTSDLQTLTTENTTLDTTGYLSNPFTTTPNLQTFSMLGNTLDTSGYLTMRKYATGGIANKPSIFGESGIEAAVPLPDGRSIPVTLSTAANDSNKNSDAELAELKKQNQLLAAQNAILQAGFQQLLSMNKQQVNHLDNIDSTTRKQVNQ